MMDKRKKYQNTMEIKSIINKYGKRKGHIQSVPLQTKMRCN